MFYPVSSHNQGMGIHFSQIPERVKQLAHQVYAFVTSIWGFVLAFSWLVGSAFGLAAGVVSFALVGLALWGVRKRIQYLAQQRLQPQEVRSKGERRRLEPLKTSTLSQKPAGEPEGSFVVVDSPEGEPGAGHNVGWFMQHFRQDVAGGMSYIYHQTRELVRSGIRALRVTQPIALDVEGEQKQSAVGPAPQVEATVQRMDKLLEQMKPLVWVVGDRPSLDAECSQRQFNKLASSLSLISNLPELLPFHFPLGKIFYAPLTIIRKAGHHQAYSLFKESYEVPCCMVSPHEDLQSEGFSQILRKLLRVALFMKLPAVLIAEEYLTHLSFDKVWQCIELVRNEAEFRGAGVKIHLALEKLYGEYLGLAEKIPNG